MSPRPPPPADWDRVIISLSVERAIQHDVSQVDDDVAALRAFAFACRDLSWELQRHLRPGVPMPALAQAALDFTVPESIRDAWQGAVARLGTLSRSAQSLLGQSAAADGLLPALIDLPGAAVDDIGRLGGACLSVADALTGVARLKRAMASETRDGLHGDGGRLPDAARRGLWQWARAGNHGTAAVARWCLMSDVRPHKDAVWSPREPHGEPDANEVRALAETLRKQWKALDQQAAAPPMRKKRRVRS
jgi:hypothetical protein